ncbi:MAG TPA: septal ring lytic transglycosylase RlpA family lipoprotein [Acidovorax sp.]|nr:septal ring lytic transglycosylase RlpA family lipoprotein [Acidovorax sp.]
MRGQGGLAAGPWAAAAQSTGCLGWRALALACCVVVAGCASGERSPGERPEGGGAQAPAPAPKVAVPPQRPGKPAKAPLADLSHSEATETDDADPGTPSNPAPLTAPSRAQADQVGLASWYGGKFHRRRTASGELFDMRALTAAHPTLPFGSFVCVRSTVNGRTVIVRINDRGPHTGNRVIDLSRAAAEELGMIGLGLKPVELFALEEGERDCPAP